MSALISEVNRVQERRYKELEDNQADLEDQDPAKYRYYSATDQNKWFNFISYKFYLFF